MHAHCSPSHTHSSCVFCACCLCCAVQPHCFRLIKDRVYYVSESLMKKALNAYRDHLVRLFLCLCCLVFLFVGVLLLFLLCCAVLFCVLFYCGVVVLC